MHIHPNQMVKVDARDTKKNVMGLVAVVDMKSWKMVNLVRMVKFSSAFHFCALVLPY